MEKEPLPASDPFREKREAEGILEATFQGKKIPMILGFRDVRAAAAGQRVSLCWASANRDATVFKSPDEVRLARKPNPHIAFGSGAHHCLGALHARLLTRSLLRQLGEGIAGIEILEAKTHVERESDYERRLGYDALTVRMSPPHP